MRVQDVWPYLGDKPLEPPRRCRNLGQVAHPADASQHAGRLGGAIEGQPVHHFRVGAVLDMLGRRQVKGFPPAPLLFFQD